MFPLCREYMPKHTARTYTQHSNLRKWRKEPGQQKTEPVDENAPKTITSWCYLI